MASPFINIFFFSFPITHFYTVICDNGWIVAKHDPSNKWASINMCFVNDTLRNYKKESVLVEYDKCQTSHPQFFSNNGDTVFKLDRPGSIYFISWATGYYQRGQEMVEKIVQAIDEFVVNCDPETIDASINTRVAYDASTIAVDSSLTSIVNTRKCIHCIQASTQEWHHRLGHASVNVLS
ncbi:hypothetical protein V6Z11_D11G041500 [Gossypium hirsutum]